MSTSSASLRIIILLVCMWSFNGANSFGTLLALLHDGIKRIADGTLVALTLMIAEIRMDEMDILVKVRIDAFSYKNCQCIIQAI